MTLRIGLLGCGKQAPKHLSGLLANPDVSVVLYDQNVELAKKLAVENNVTYVDNADGIFTDKTVSGIDICTPVDSHIDYITRGLSAGMDFFCEKPLCNTYEEAIEIQSAMEKAGKFGMVGFNYRYAPAMIEAQNILAGAKETGVSAVLGKITGGLIRVGGRGGHQLWKHRVESGGGAINEMIVHLIDLVYGFLGKISQVDVLDKRLVRAERMINGEFHQVDAEDFLLVKLTSETGISVICQADMVTPSFIHYVDIEGENGNFFGSVQPDMPTFVYCEHSAGGYESGKTNLEFGMRNFFEAQMAAFITAIRTGTPPTNGTVADSVEIIRILDIIRNA